MIKSTHALNQTSFQYFSDLFGVGIASFSVARKLNSAYVGPAFRLINVALGTFTDIGFVNNVIDEAAITTFLAGAQGTISVIYDQSGNGRNLNCIAANANKAEICPAGGSIHKLNGVPAVRHITSSSYFDLDTWSGGSRITDFNFGTGNYSINFVTAISDLTVNQIIFGQYVTWVSNMDFALRFRGTSTDDLAWIAYDSIPVVLESATVIDAIKANKPQIFHFNKDTSVSKLYVNGVEKSSAADSNNFQNDGTFIRIGKGADNSEPQTNGYFQELIIYNSSKLADITNIYNNQNTFYN